MKQTVAVILGLAAALSAAGVEAMENPLVEPKIEQFVLENGLRVYMVVDRTAPLVAVDVNYHVGSRNEKKGKTGFAHLFEHMMFQGSKNYDDDYFKPLQDIGGQVNGATSTDRTRYWEIVPSPYLERALWLESDRMGYLLDAMTQERLDNQKSVVSNERRQNYDNRPYGTVWEKMAAVLYPPSHPYSWLTIGSMEDIANATLADVSDFFRTYYTPNNATLAIVGDFDPAAAKDLVRRYFGEIPPGPPVSAIANWKVALDHDVILDIADRVQLPRTYVTWPTVSQFDADEAALDVFGMILGGGRTSRLYQELVYKRQIAQDAVAGQRSSQMAGVFDMMLTPRPGTDQVELESAAMEVLETALKNGITKAELERVQISVMSSFVKEMEHIGGFGGMADRINAYVHFTGRPDGFRADLQRYLDLKPTDVMAAARRHLSGHHVTARVKPAGEGLAASGVPADRKSLPGKGKDAVFDLPDRKGFVMPNGLKVVLVENDKVPLINMNLIVRGGSGVDPEGREGLASLTAALLSEGAGGLDSRNFAEAVEAIGGQLDVTAGADAWFASGSVLKTNIRKMMKLFADMVSRPTLPAEELERQRAERLTRIRQYMDVPQYVASIAARRAVYGSHPYGRATLGTARAVEAIDINDVKSLYSAWFNPSSCVMVVVGDIGVEDLKREMQSAFGQWKDGRTKSVAALNQPQYEKPSVTVVDMPGAKQSVIIVAAPGPARTAQSTAVLDVLNTAVGGQFVSRLNLNLREDKGYTYGARSVFEMNAAGGIFKAAAPVQTEVTGAAIAEMIAELTGIGTSRPMDEKEITYVRDSIVNGYAGRFATMEQTASELLEVYLYGLDPESVETYPGEISGTSVPEVTAAARYWLDADRLSVIVAGDAAKVVPQIRKAGITEPVSVVDREGRPVAGY